MKGENVIKTNGFQGSEADPEVLQISWGRAKFNDFRLLNNSQQISIQYTFFMSSLGLASALKVACEFNHFRAQSCLAETVLLLFCDTLQT